MLKKFCCCISAPSLPYPFPSAVSMAAAAPAALSSAPSTLPLRRFATPLSPALPLLHLSSLSVSSYHRRLFAPPLPRPEPARPSRVLAAAGGEDWMTAVAVEEEKGEVAGEGADGAAVRREEMKAWVRPCELYVCNLPRSCDISQILNLFEPFGTVCSVEICRDEETGLSRGCGYVTMGSLREARAAIEALNKSDVGMREILVAFSADMGSGRTNMEALNTAPKKDLIFESPHKVYVGNLAWSVRPEDLREHLSQFGTVVSTRLLYDRQGGKNRVYGFVSFSSSSELKAAVEINGSEFHGRTLLVREVLHKEE